MGLEVGLAFVLCEGQEQDFGGVAVAPLYQSVALAITTDVLPFPAAATTRLRPSSITTACLCSSVRALDSTVSKKLRERFNSLLM